ncbi:MAG: cytoplasmic protein [Candidatus Pacebacteria bacterium]|nr:cytoplasmic protein [Candidatus Paceibacterota bacterium]
MPKYDGTGPLGQGPGTGWGMGPCCGYGMRRGGRRFYTKQEEKELLEEEVKTLEEELQAIKERLAELKD